MTHTSKLYGALAPILALAALAAPSKRPPQPVPATGAGTITLLTGLGSPFGAAGPLTEVAPGLFAGFANSPNGAAFLMTSKGALTLLYTFPANTGVAYAHPLQAVNGRLYGYEGTNAGTPSTSANVSLNLGGKPETYPPTVTKYAPILSIQLPDGSLYGTESNSLFAQDNALVKLTLNGAAKIIHSFARDEPTASPYWARTPTSTASPGWAALHPSAAPRPWSIASRLPAT